MDETINKDFYNLDFWGKSQGNGSKIHGQKTKIKKQEQNVTLYQGNGDVRKGWKGEEGCSLEVDFERQLEETS